MNTFSDLPGIFILVVLATNKSYSGLIMTVLLIVFTLLFSNFVMKLLFPAAQIRNNVLYVYTTIFSILKINLNKLRLLNIYLYNNSPKLFEFVVSQSDSNKNKNITSGDLGSSTQELYSLIISNVDSAIVNEVASNSKGILNKTFTYRQLMFFTYIALAIILMFIILSK